MKRKHARNLGALNMTFNRTPRPYSSQWGAVQHADEMAPGIWHVSTAGHGGIVVSGERLAAMPKDWRCTAYSARGEFEEDCDWALPYVVFHRELDPKHLAMALKTIGFSHPDKLELARTLAGVTA
jgi:hypothetical protein